MSPATMRQLAFLMDDQAEWSQKTFGPRGPVGALFHLSREAVEAAQCPTDLVEYADCFLLLLDAMRRAGFTFDQLVHAATMKLVENKGRRWPAPTAEDKPVMHLKGVEAP